MAGPTTFDYFTLSIAVVGAVTGIAALGAAWAQFVLSGPRLKVTGSMAVSGEQRARFFLSVSVENRGRTAASVPSVGLQLEGDEKQHVPVGMLRWQGHAHGPDFPVRLEPFEAQTWLVEVQPVIKTLRSEGKSTRVTPFAHYAGKDVTAAKSIDLVDIVGRHD